MRAIRLVLQLFVEFYCFRRHWSTCWLASHSESFVL